jgi:RsiW-degrading membrane proteinase PrsW (M82 family)
MSVAAKSKKEAVMVIKLLVALIPTLFLLFLLYIDRNKKPQPKG